MFLLLAGGLLIILLAVVIAVVSSVVSAVAAATDDAEDWHSGLRTVSFLLPVRFSPPGLLSTSSVPFFLPAAVPQPLFPVLIH